MDPKKYEENFSSIVHYGFVGLEVAKGHKLGLFEVFRSLKEPVTSHELAAKCQLKERYVREWLGCMSAAQIICITDDDEYYIPEECKPYTNSSQTLGLLPVLARNSEKVIECIKEDGPNGYNYAGHHDVFAWLDEGRSDFDFEYIEQNIFPTGCVEKDSIINVLDFGCGSGVLTIKIAEYLPKANIIGIDIEPHAISESNKKLADGNVSNVEFILGDGSLDQAWNGKFDWIIMMDVLHDLPNPDSVMADLKRILKDGGIISAVDPEMHSDHKKNVGNSVAAMYYVFSSNVCLPCSMSAPPAVGNGIGWGLENRASYIKSLDFKIMNDEIKPTIHMKKA